MREQVFSSTNVKNNLEDSSTSSVFQCYNSSCSVFSSPCSHSPLSNRRHTIVISGVIFFIGAILMGLSTNYTFLMCDHFVAGIGVCYALTIAPVYSAEVSSASSRSFLTSFPDRRQWRALVLLGSLPPQRTLLKAIFAFYIHKRSVNQVLELLIEFRCKPNRVSSNRAAVEAEGEEVYNKDGVELEK
ncbi:hypothetical protein PS2_007678 [Malus domestica]